MRRANGVVHDDHESTFMRLELYDADADSLWNQVRRDPERPVELRTVRTQLHHPAERQGRGDRRRMSLGSLLRAAERLRLGLRPLPGSEARRRLRDQPDEHDELRSMRKGVRRTDGTVFHHHGSAHLCLELRRPGAHPLRSEVRRYPE